METKKMPNSPFFAFYNVEHIGTKCLGVEWSPEGRNIFYFRKDNEDFVFEQMRGVDCTSDTDHIKKVIEYQFLPWWADKKIEDLNRRYDALAREFERALNYIKMIKRFDKDAEN